jgi:hypothetical protein
VIRLALLLSLLISCVDDDTTTDITVPTCAEVGCPAVTGLCRAHDECTCMSAPGVPPVVCTINEAQ